MLLTQKDAIQNLRSRHVHFTEHCQLYCYFAIRKSSFDFESFFSYSSRTLTRIKCTFFPAEKKANSSEVFELFKPAHWSHAIVILGYVIKVNDKTITIIVIWLAEKCCTYVQCHAPKWQSHATSVCARIIFNLIIIIFIIYINDISYWY